MERRATLSKVYLLAGLVALGGCPGEDDLPVGGTEGAQSTADSTEAGSASSTASGETENPSSTNPSMPATTNDPASSTAPSMSDTASASASASVTESVTDTTPETDGESESETATDTEDPPEAGISFVALGDGGEGNDAQYAVANVMEQVCTDRGCEFALYLGDNFYDVGVTSTMDQQFTDKFEMPYADVTDMPFYITLGNHDYGTLGNEWFKAQFQIEYAEFSEKWTMPSEFYTFDAGGVTFINLDSARLFWDHETDQIRDFVRSALADSPNQVSVAFGHHPYISNGRHGNAGNYEGFPIPIVGGEDIKDFFDEEICGKVTMYFSGHDHNRQWHPETCGTVFVVSGAAAKTTGFENRDGNPAPLFQDDQTPGLAWVNIDGRELTMAFYDREGTMEFQDSVTLP